MQHNNKLRSAFNVIWKWTKITFLASLVIGLFVLLFLMYANYSDGTRTGYVTKFSRKGYIFKTYEGELNTGFWGNNAGNTPLPNNTWYFSVSDKSIAEQVQKASESGQKVTLHYRQKYVKMPFRGDTDYFIWKVDHVPETQPYK